MLLLFLWQDDKPVVEDDEDEDEDEDEDDEKDEDEADGQLNCMQDSWKINCCLFSFCSKFILVYQF